MMRRRLTRALGMGLMMGVGLAAGLTMLADRGRIAGLEKRLARVEAQALAAQTELPVATVATLSREPSEQTGPALEVSGWFIDRPETGPRGHYTIQPQIRNATDRDIQMIEAFVLFRTKTGDVICAMDLTRDMRIKAGQSVMEPQSHRVGWERLHKLNLSGLRSEDIVADLQITKVVFEDL